MPRLVPLRDLAAGVAQRARAERLDHPRLLGDRDEVRRPDDAALGIAPAQERLDAERAAAREVDLRLVDEEELVVHEPAAHVGLDLQALAHARVHVGRVEAIGVAARLLRGVHRGVRLLDQRRRVLRVEREHRHADRAGERRRLVGDAERRVEGVADAMHDGHDLEGRVRGVEAGQHEHELVAAEARDRVRLAHRRREPLRDRLQQLVAGVVAERVVDALEVVEVEEQAGDLRGVALRLREDLLQPLVQQRAVRQAGEDVVLRELVGVRGRDLELARALRDLVLQRALVGRHLRLRLGQPLRHVVEGVRQQAEFVARVRRDEDVEPAARDRARGAHQPSHRRDQPARQQHRRDQRDEHEESDDGQRAGRVAAEAIGLFLERQADPHVADRRHGRGAAGRGGLRRGGLAGVHGHDGLEVGLGADRAPHGAGDGRRRDRGRDRRGVEAARVATLGDRASGRVDHRRVGDRRRARGAGEQLLERVAVGRVERELGDVREHAPDRLRLRAQLLLLAGPLAPEHGRR